MRKIKKATVASLLGVQH